MANIFKNLIKPMFSHGKETLTVQLDSNYTRSSELKEAVVNYLNTTGFNCLDKGETLGSFHLLELEGKPYIFENRFLSCGSTKELSQVAVLIER
ncbi:MAG: hypothetical protein ACRDD2_07575 [Sarcina sp.]